VVYWTKNGYGLKVEEARDAKIACLIGAFQAAADVTAINDGT